MIPTGEQLDKLDQLINEKAAEGGELVAYTCMGGSNAIQKDILATFRREKDC